MTAGVANVRQGVVLAQHGDLGALAPRPGLEGRRHAVGPSDRCEPLLVEDVGQDLVGVVFLVAQLRVRMDVVGGGEQHLGELIDMVADPRLRRVGGGGHSTLIILHGRMVPRPGPTGGIRGGITQTTTRSASSSRRTERRRALAVRRPSSQIGVGRANSTCSARVRV